MVYLCFTFLKIKSPKVILSIIYFFNFILLSHKDIGYELCYISSNLDFQILKFWHMKDLKSTLKGYWCMVLVNSVFIYFFHSSLCASGFREVLLKINMPRNKVNFIKIVFVIEEFISHSLIISDTLENNVLFGKDTLI